MDGCSAEATSERALVARGVTKRFGGIAALQSVDFSGCSGEVHGLLGENGAGKSTFIKLIVGALRPDAGKIMVFGEALGNDPRIARRLGVAAVLQEIPLIPDLTVAQNVWFREEPMRRLGLISERRLRSMTRDLFGRLGVDRVSPDALVRDLSLSDRQLIDISRAVARSPRVLILDEATSALPPQGVEWALSLARDVARRGGLVIFISHRMREVRSVADRITIFRNSRAVGTYRTEEASDETLITEMLGRSPQMLYPPPRREPTARLMLEVRGLSAGDRLKNVALDLRKGEILGIGGLQGQGQNELLLALAGLLPARGEVKIDGVRTEISNARQALRAGIALIPEDRQSQGLLLTKTIRHNASLSILDDLTTLGILNLSKESYLVESMTRKLNVKAASVDQVVRTLSGGNQQKVLMARVLLTKARILLLNDPARGVDVGTKADIFGLLRQLTAEGYGVVLHSTDFQELVNLSDRLVIMRGGSVSALLRGAELTETNALGASVGNPVASSTGDIH